MAGLRRNDTCSLASRCSRSCSCRASGLPRVPARVLRALPGLGDKYPAVVDVDARRGRLRGLSRVANAVARRRYRREDGRRVLPVAAVSARARLKLFGRRPTRRAWRATVTFAPSRPGRT